ncbi:MAG: VOC family protein [Acidobacteriia bacterium]|nr:VOC family protein [Terriglobia bacterium]
MRSGAMGRRAALGAMGAAAWAARQATAAGEPGFGFRGLDHVEFWTADVEKSAGFYARVFGPTVLKNRRTPRRYVKLGSGFVAMDKGPEIRVDHVCAGIEGFQIASLHSYLEQQGLAYKDYPSGKDLYVTDPDGTRLQLGAADSWSGLPGDPEAVAAAGGPIFQPAGIDHILLNVSDVAKAEAFYEKIFGPVTQRRNNRTWFQAGKSRVGLLKTPGGQRAGVNHYCVLAGAFNYDEAVRKLTEAGAQVEKPEIAGAPEFRDPDGYLVQVMGPRTA